MNSHQLTSVEAIRAFVLAGNATITLVSKRTGTRFTYRIRQPRGDNKPHFVAALTGSNNETDFAFLGTVFVDGNYRHGGRSRITFDAPSAIAFRWFWETLRVNRIHDQLEVWHEGRCGRCGRKLTVPESIASGLGPECAGRRNRVQPPIKQIQHVPVLLGPTLIDRIEREADVQLGPTDILRIEREMDEMVRAGEDEEERRRMDADGENEEYYEANRDYDSAPSGFYNN